MPTIFLNIAHNKEKISSNLPHPECHAWTYEETLNESRQNVECLKVFQQMFKKETITVESTPLFFSETEAKRRLSLPATMFSMLKKKDPGKPSLEDCKLYKQSTEFIISNLQYSLVHHTARFAFLTWLCIHSIHS